MVRADHEDGGVLNSDDEDRVKRPAPVVTKSSPLGRKPKAGKRRAGTPKPGKQAKSGPESVEKSAIPGIGEDRADPGADDRTDTVDPASRDADGPDEDTADTDAADTDADDADAAPESVAVGYRDRRVATQRRRTAREAAASAKKSGTAASSGSTDQRTALWVVGLCVGTVVLVAGTVLSIFFGMRYAEIQDERELRAEYATFARQVVVQMTTLDAENADNMYKLAMEKTSGRAQQVFRDNMKTVSELIRQGDAETKTTVLTEAVSKATPDEGEVLMVVGWEHRSKDADEAPLFQTFRYQVGMTRLNGELKVTELEFVW
ncbi:hypothetical protein [Gordonia iterans]